MLRRAENIIILRDFTLRNSKEDQKAYRNVLLSLLASPFVFSILLATVSLPNELFQL